MTRLTCTMIVATSVITAFCNAADAGHPHTVVVETRSAHAVPVHKHVRVPHHVNYHDIRWNPHRPPTKQEWQLRRYQQMYPKFYYGFHGRFLYTLGMPSGDVGIRGLPW